MWYARMLIVVLTEMARSSGAFAADFVIQLEPNATPADRSRIQAIIGAQPVRNVPSLGRGVEVWRTEKDSKEVTKKLNADKSVNIKDEVSADYTDLFSE